MVALKFGFPMKDHTMVNTLPSIVPLVALVVMVVAWSRSPPSAGIATFAALGLIFVSHATNGDMNLISCAVSRNTLNTTP